MAKFAELSVDDDEDSNLLETPNRGAADPKEQLLRKNERLMTPEERKAARKLRKQQAKEQKQVRGFIHAGSYSCFRFIL